MAKGYLSNRQKNLKVGISSYTENSTVLEVTGKVGIRTDNAQSALDVRGTISIGRTDFAGINSIRSVVDINSWEYYGVSFSVGGQDTAPSDVFFKDDGTKMFILGDTGNDVNEYALSTPWEVSSATFTTNFSIAAQETVPTGLYFKPDGTRMYICGQTGVSPTGDRVYSYTLSNPWSLVGVTTDTVAGAGTTVKNFNVGANDTGPHGLYFKDDGTKMYVVGVTGDAVYEYTVSTAWEIDSTVTLNHTLLIGTANTQNLPLTLTNPTGIDFNTSGTKMYITDSTRDLVARFDLSTPWDLSTAVFYDNVYIGFQETAPTGIFYQEDQSKAYIVGTTGDTVYQYNTDVPSLELASSGISTRSSIILNNEARLNNRLYVTGDTHISSNTTLKGTLQVDGSVATSSNLTVSGGTITAGNIAATLLGGNTTTNITAFGGLTSGTLTVGGASQTGTITIDQSASAHTLNIASGANASGVSKTVNIATGGASGSRTLLTLGSATAGAISTVTIPSPTNLLIGTATTTGTASQALQVNSGAYVSGNLGVGATNPTSKLDIQGDATVFGVLQSQGFLLTGIATISVNSSSDALRINQLGSGNALVVEDSANPDATPFVVRGDGNTGIGTTNPVALLHLQNNAPLIRFAESDASANNRNWNVGVNEQEFYWQALTDAGSGGGNLFKMTRSAEQIQTFEGRNSGNTWFIANNNTQRVGIGTINPTSKLHVVGDGNFTGQVTASSFSGNASSATYATNAGLSTNLKGGLAGNLVYQSATDTTAFLANGSSGTILKSNGVGNAPSWVAAAPANAITGLTIRDEGNVVGSANNVSELNFVGNIVSVASTLGIATITFSNYVDNAGIATYATTAGVATALQNARTFEITGDIVASPISFDGTGNVSLAATIQPNSVALGGDTTGDYVQSISGTSNQITVTGGTGEGSTPTLSIPNQFTIPQDATVTRDLQVNRNLNVTGNITIGGTSATIFSQTLNIFDPDIVLGFRTDALGNDTSTDNTANHGGIAIASTEGTPLISLYDVGVGETNPSTYKKFMWFKSGTFSGLGTDAWISNYAIGIGSTQVPNDVRLAAGGMQVTDSTLSVPQLNISGVSTFTGAVSFGTSAYFGANDKIIFGDAQRLQIYHNNSDAYISNSNLGGELFIESNNIYLRPNTGLIIVDRDSAHNRAIFATGVDLYYNNVLRFETTGYGVTVYGGLQVSGIVTASQFTTGSGNLGFTTNTISGPSEIIIDPSPVGVGTTSGIVRVRGDLYVDGTQFIVNSTTIELADFNVGIATTVGTNLLLDGAGIGIGSTGIRKTITWNNTASALTSSEDWNIASGKIYEIGGTSVLSSTTLGSGVVNSSLTSVGTLGQLNVSGITTTNNLNVTGVGTFLSSGLKIRNPANTFQYNITGDAIVADRTLNLPVITGTDTLAVLGINQTFTGAQTFGGILSATSTLSLTGSATGIHRFGTQQTSASITLGGSSGTGLITLGQATTSQQTDIQAGASGVGTTKTINLGTGGLSGSFTQIDIGPTAGVGTVVINTGTNLGIGTTNPTSRLTVSGDARVSGVVTAMTFSGQINAGVSTLGVTTTTNLTTQQLSVSGLSTFSNNINVASGIITTTGSGGVGIGSFLRLKPYLTEGGEIGFDYTNGSLGYYLDVDGGNQFRFANYDTTGVWKFLTNSTEKVRITNNGNVGINTTNPLSKLHVEQTTEGEIARFRASDSTRYLTIKSFNSGFNGSGIEFDATSSAGVLRFSTNSIEKVRITTDGNVGIGTDNPQDTLQVNGDLRLQAAIPEIKFRSGGNVNQYYIGANISDSVDGGFIIGEGSGITGGSTRFLIDTNGNVGINSSSPTSRLDVVGNIKLTGAIYGPTELVIDPAAVGDNTGAVRIKGDLYVDGTQTYINSTTIELADFNVGIATTVGTNLLLDGAGIGIGSTNIRKTITWNNTASALTSSEDWNLVSGKQYEINGTSVLSSTTLGSGVVNSSLTSVGTLGQLNVSGVSTFQGNVYLGDADSLYFGNGNDLRILHNGTDSYIVDENQGNLYIGGSNEVIIANAALNETKAKFITNGAVELYYDNTKEFETTGYGATVFGTLQSQGLNVSGVTTSSGGFVGNLTGTATTATNLADAANITTGTINSARLSGTYDINVSYASTAGIATVAQGLTGTPNISVGVVTATSFVKSGGTSSQFLKADGSVDSSTYLASYTETDTLNSVTGRGNSTVNGISIGILTATSGNFSGIVTSSGAVISGATTATSFVKSGGTSSQFLKADGSVDSSTYLTTTGSGTNLTGIVTSITAGTNITISNSTGNVTINAAGGGGGGGSGTFDTGISTSIYISVTSGVGINTTQTNDIFVGPGIAGTTIGIGYSFPSTAGRKYVIESIHVTNTFSNELYLVARHDFSGGSAVPTVQRVVIPYQGSAELLSQPIIANPSDILRFQALSGVGNTAVGIDGGLDAFVVYSTKTDTNYVGTGATVTSSTGTGIFTSTTYPSVIQSIRICNYNLNIDVDASISIYRGTVSAGVRLGYLVYNMTIPKNSVIEILEKPKYLATNDTIVAVGSTTNSLGVTVSGKYIV